LDRLEKTQKIETIRFVDNQELPIFKAEILSLKEEVQISNDKLREAELKIMSLQVDN